VARGEARGGAPGVKFLGWGDGGDEIVMLAGWGWRGGCRVSEASSVVAALLFVIGRATGAARVGAGAGRWPLQAGARRGE
jgi:hypothetical protein